MGRLFHCCGGEIIVKGHGKILLYVLGSLRFNVAFENLFKETFLNVFFLYPTSFKLFALQNFSKRIIFFVPSVVVSVSFCLAFSLSCILRSIIAEKI